MMTRISHLLIYIALTSFALVATALTASAQKATVARTWLFGAGGGALYDAYLSPLNYHGTAANITMINERTKRLGDHYGKTKVMFDLNGSATTNPGGNGHLYDGELMVAAGYYYGWRFFNGQLCTSLGALAEISGGGTYSSRNGNNPAQGRARFDIAPSADATYAFSGPRFLRTTDAKGRERMWQTKLMLDIPLAGVMFSPQYGQSYYEIFVLGHYDHNVCFSWPGNAPSARLHALLSIPVRHSGSFVIGYRGLALQSHVNGLGRHNWQNGAVIGFTHIF